MERTTQSALGGSVVGPSPARDMYIGRVGQSLAPRLIASILNNCDAGFPAQWHDLLNELRQKDASLHSLLQTRELALLSRGWSVSPIVTQGEDEPLSQDEEIADFSRELLGGIKALNKSLAHLLDGTFKGYSVCEQEYQKVSGLGVVPVHLNPVHGRRWKITTEQQLVWYDDGLINPPVDVLAEHPIRFVVHHPRVNGDALSREGLGRTVVWYCAFENWAWRDWMLFAEMFGKPQRRVEYDPGEYQGTTDEDIKAALDAATSSGYTIFPKGTKLITEWPGGQGNVKSPSPDIIDKCADWKSLAILGQRSTIAKVQNGLGGGGDSRDLVRKDIVKADDIAISETVRWQVLAPSVRMKFGPNAKPPLFGFDIEESVDIKTLAEGFDKLADRMPIPTRHVYEVTGIPKPVDNEPVLSAKAATAAPAPANDTEPDGATGPTGASGPTGPANDDDAE